MIAEATRFACPHCGADVLATPEMAGWVTECPDCHGEIKIDDPQPDTRRRVVLHRRPNTETSNAKPQQKSELQELIVITRDIRRIMLIVVITPAAIAILSAVWYGTLRFIDLLQ